MTRLHYLTSLSAFILLFGLMTNAYAEHENHGTMKLDMKVTMMQKKLNLSDAQADQVYEILAAKHESQPCKDIEKFSARKNCRMEQREDINQQLMSVLSKEQQADFVKFREQRQQKWGHKGGKSAE